MADEEIIQDGSEEHPWLVSNYSELKNLYKTATSGDYAKLTADINCNEQCPDGWTTVYLNFNLDLDGHQIVAPSIKDGNKLFHPYISDDDGGYVSAIRRVYNGYILNIFENFSGVGDICGMFYKYNYSAGTARRAIRFEDMGISMYLRNKCNFYTCGFYRCTVEINGVLKYNDSSSFFREVHDSDGYRCNAEDSRFILNYSAPLNGTRLGYLFSYGYTKKRINRCRFEGKVDNFNLCSNSENQIGYENDGSIVNSIILVESNDSYRWGYSCYNSCIISDKCKSFIVSGDDAIVMSDEDIKSFDSVNNAGFATVKVN